MYEVIAKAAILNESDFSEDAFDGFTAAYQKAVNVANDVISSQKEIDNAAADLRTIIAEKNEAPEIIGIYAMIPSNVLPVGREMPITVTAQYNRGTDKIITEDIIVETEDTKLQWIDGKLKAISAGETVIKVSYKDNTCELTVLIPEN